MQRQPAPDSSHAALPPVIQQYIKLSDPPDQIKLGRETHRSRIEKELRQAMQDLPYEQAKDVACQLDGLITMLVLIKLVEVMQHETALTLSQSYGLNMQGVAEDLEKKIEAYLDSIVAKNQQVDRNKIETFTQLALDEVLVKAGCSPQKLKTLKSDEQFRKAVTYYGVLVSAHKVYFDTDDMQMLDPAQMSITNIISMGQKVFRIYRMPTAKIQQSYAGLRLCVEIADILPAHKPQWRLIAALLYGLYHRVYDAIARMDAVDKGKYLTESGGVKKIRGVKDKVTHYPIVDAADEKFFEFKLLTKYDMALLNKDLAEYLESKFNLTASHAATSSLSAAAGAAAVSSAVTEQPVLGMKIVGFDGYAQVIVTVPDAVRNKDFMDRLTAAITDVIHFDENKLPNMLQTIMINSQPDLEARIWHLEYCLKQCHYQLAEYQKALLANIPDNVNAMFDAYCGRGYLFSSVHAARAREIKKEISESESPADWLQLLFKFRTELISQSSVALRRHVDDILVHAFTALSTKSPVLSAAAVM